MHLYQSLGEIDACIHPTAQLGLRVHHTSVTSPSRVSHLGRAEYFVSTRRASATRSFEFSLARSCRFFGRRSETKIEFWKNNYVLAGYYFLIESYSQNDIGAFTKSAKRRILYRGEGDCVRTVLHGFDPKVRRLPPAPSSPRKLGPPKDKIAGICSAHFPGGRFLRAFVVSRFREPSGFVKRIVLG